MSDHSHTHCHDLIDHLSDYLDGEIPAALREEIEEHIHGCEKCRIVVDTTRKTIYLYHQHADDQQAPDAVIERLYRTLQLDDYLPEK